MSIEPGMAFLAIAIGIAIMLGVQRLARWDLARRERKRQWDGRAE